MDHDDDTPEMTEFQVTIRYNVKLPKAWVEAHTDDGTGILTSVVFAAAGLAQVGDLDGWINPEDLMDDGRATSVEQLFPPEGVAYEAGEVSFDYEGVG
jgi:hypothetical protein